LVYGCDYVIEKANEYLYDNSTGSDRILNDQKKLSEYIDYYYHAIFIVKPTLNYFMTLLKTSLQKVSDNWRVTYSLLLMAISIYLVIYIILMIASIRYSKKEYSSYAIFYTIVPKEIRSENLALRDYVTQLIKISE